MIHLFEILILFLCIGVVVYFYKKISAQPEDKSIAIFSTIIATISIITLTTGYLWISYSQNIDWSFIRPQWQEVNTKDWNDINYIESKTGGIIALVSGLTNPIVAVLAFFYAMGEAMTGNPQPTNQMEILLFFIIPVLLSLIIYIKLSSILAKIIRKITRGKIQFILVSLITLIIIGFAIFLFFANSL